MASWLYTVIVSYFTFIVVAQEIIAMRIVVQRVKNASVTVDGSIVSSIGPGAMSLIGIHENDTQEDLDYCCKKLLGCKLWENEKGTPWRHGIKQRKLELLCVSQFTLYGKLTKKHQPDYKASMKAIPAKALYETFLTLLQTNYQTDKIKDGVFGAMMDVALVNDGPVTIVIDSEDCPSSKTAATIELANS